MSTDCEITLHRPTDEKVQIEFAGSWVIEQPLPAVDDIQQQVADAPGLRQVTFKTERLTQWDSNLLTYLKKLTALCQQRQIKVDLSGLPKGAQKLLALSVAVPRKEDAHSEVQPEPFLAAVGGEVLQFFNSCGELLTFVGGAFMALVKMLGGRASFRPVDLGLFLQDAGAKALPIVSLISLLVGLILAFVGIIQLELFGAQVFVADLVGIGMVRQMGAIMTGIIMAGRTGAAYAAQLGTMQVNEEIDALATLGVDPMEFLVLPRMLALTVMMPLLCLYANLMGMLGGFIVAAGFYGVGPRIYIDRTVNAVGLNDLGIGLFMSLVFGILVALAGCLRGMQCGRSASSVGDAATSAVVTGIVAIIVATAIITVVCNSIGI